MKRVAPVVLLVSVSLSVAGCADPQKTAARGAREVERHRGDPLRAVIVDGLTLTEDVVSPAHTEGVLGADIGNVAVPTMFRRRFRLTKAVQPVAVASEFERALVAAGATPVGTSCRISVPLRQQTFSATSFGDDVRITVIVASHVEQGVDEVIYALEIERAVLRPTTGLRDCLTRRLPAEAYVSAWPNNPRTPAEACALLSDEVRSAVFGGTFRMKYAQSCNGEGTFEGRSGWVQVLDARSASRAVLLDDAPPDADPGAGRIDAVVDGIATVTLFDLRRGAVRVRSNLATIASAVADAIEREHI